MFLSLPCVWLRCRYATAVNAEKQETSDRIREKVAEMTERMKKSSKFNAGNIKELEEAMEALFECRRTVKFFYVKQVRDKCRTWACHAHAIC